jgi:acyl transferase domain-containing protein
MTGETSAAVAGGANIMLTLQTSARICLLQALSPVGRCKTFEASGDGYGRGEAFTVAYMRCPTTLTARLFRLAASQQ